MSMSYDITLKRIYAEPETSDGARILVDRLWPRGMPRERLKLTDWYRNASPSLLLSRQLRTGEISNPVFAVRYRGELRDAPDHLLPLMRHARRGRLTLLSAARDLEVSHLPLLRQAIVGALQKEDAEDDLPSSPPCYLGLLDRDGQNGHD
jgi:uncharacterized protein YeaO (DUF488 family)